MKQTNNAIKFLMAQYRAIFNNAYFKGLATLATATTLALAAGQAQAAKTDFASGSNYVADNITQVVDKKKVETTSNEDTLTITGKDQKFVNGIEVKQGHKLTMSGSVVSVDNVNVTSGSLVIGNASGDASSLILASKIVESTKKVYDKDLTATGATIEVANANVGMADFDIKNSTLNLSTKAGAVSSLTAYGEGTKQNGENAEGLQFNATGKLTNVKTTINGATNITVIGKLTVAGEDKTKSEITLKGIDGTSGKTYKDKLAYVGAGRQIDISKTTINVSGGVASSSGTAISAPVLNINDSEIKIDGTTSDILTLGSLYDRNKAGGETIDASHVDNRGKVNIANSKITLATATNAVLNFGAEGSKTVVTFSGTNEIDNKGIVNFFSPETNMSATDLNAFVKNGKVDFKTDKSVLNVSGELDLNTNKIIKSDGDLENTKFAATGLTLKGESVALGSAYKADKLAIEADTLKLAKGETFTFSSGSLTAKSSLTAADELKNVVISGTASNGAKLVLGKDANASGSVTNIKAFSVGATGAGATGTLEVNGQWDFGGANLTIDNSGAATINGSANKVGDLKMAVASGSGTLAINAGGKLEAQRLLEGADNSKITVDGTLAIVGDGKADASGSAFNNDLSLNKTNVVINAGGTFDVSSADVQDDFLSFADPDASGNTAVTIKTASGDFGGWTKDMVDLQAGGHLVLDLTGKTMSADAIKTFKSALVKDGSAGIIDIKGLSLDQASLESMKNQDGSVNLDKIIANDLAGVGIDSIKNDKATVSSGSATQMQGSVGAVEAAKGTTSLAVEKTLTLNNAASNGGKFISVQDATGAADVTVNTGAVLELNGQGEIGNISNSSKTNTALVMNAQNGTQTAGSISIHDLKVGSGTVKAKDVTADKLVLSGTLESLAKDANTHHDITAKTLETTAGSLIKTGTLAIGDSGNSTDSVIKGSVEAKKITVANNAANTLSILDGVVKADSLAFGTNGGKLFVGQDGQNSASGELDLGTLDLGGGMLILDPEWGTKASITYLGTADTSKDTAKVNGSIGVGKNSVFFAGANTTTEAEKAQAQAIVDRFTDANGSLDKDGIGALFIANKQFEVTTDKAVIVDPAKVASELETLLTTPTGNSFSLESGAALVVTEDLTESSIKSQAPVIKFQTSGGATFNAKAESSIIFDGNVFAGDKIKISDAATVTVDQKATISAANGLLNASNASGTLTFALDTKAAEKLYNQSAPVKDLTLDVVNGKFGKDLDDGAQYIHDISGFDGGKAVEGTARLAVYGGAVQGTALAQQAANDAIVERMSRSNPNGSLVFANNAQGGGLWLSPIYKSHESDSFDAEGADYGVDGYLTGLVLGADSTTDSGVRVGGYFNFGSASFDGQGVGDQVSNDADYFGFGLYAGMTSGQFSLLADAGFTQVSNDIEQSVNYKDYSKLKADVDSTAVTLGLRGEYKLNVATMDVTPHLGVRYTRLNIDSYDAKANGYILANTSFDTMQMFSIPFGVSVSKDIAAGAWAIKPVFDLTLTANAGDTDAKMNTTFIGASSLDLTSEAFDSFTYGATFGLDAKYGENFSIGLNTNYTGSSNADEFGVMGNVRYMF